jgi:hypothetical protein
MTSYRYSTIHTFLPADAGQRQRQERLANRADQLTDHGRTGWALSSTMSAPGEEGVSIIDTLTKLEESADA